MNENQLRQVGIDKTSRNRVKVSPTKSITKPHWIKVKISDNENYHKVKSILKSKKLHTVCEEASCPNIGECFGNGTATFMILGDVCTRRCPFCDVAHGRPLPPKKDEPASLAKAISELKLGYVVITSVDRDDLQDGGAEHFRLCINAIRESSPSTKIEVLIPDFRGRLDKALAIFEFGLPDVMNHNLETVPRLYREARPGASYKHSLLLLKKFKSLYPSVTTKSGLMVGLGETDDEIFRVMQDLKSSEVDLLTIGQYLQPSNGHLPVRRYVAPSQFKSYQVAGEDMGFRHVASGPLVRSSYHADQQAQSAG